MDNMVLSEWLMTGGILGILGLILKNNHEVNGKVDRNYQRLDEVKNGMENKFVPQKVCDILHKQTADDITEIKADVKAILKTVNAKNND
jgi:hypothetical protein